LFLSTLLAGYIAQPGMVAEFDMRNQFTALAGMHTFNDDANSKVYIWAYYCRVLDDLFGIRRRF
jgi:hypothetical protein